MRRGLSFAIALAGCTPEARPSVEPVHSETPEQPEVSEPSSTRAPKLLHPIAYREGLIELAPWDASIFALIEGEPIPLLAGQPVAREPSLALGLRADKSSFASTHELIAFGGIDGIGHVVYAEHFERSSSAYFGYARIDDRWRPLEVASRGDDPRIETHYGAIVRTPDALLGLRRLVIRSELWDWGDADDPGMDARLQKLGRELSKAPRGFVVLDGSPQRIPELPKGHDASDAVSLADGTIVALGYRHRTSLDDEHGPARVLSWAPGAVEAEQHELPGLIDPPIHTLALWSANDAVLVGGLRDIPGGDDQPYLAMRERDGSWTEVALQLPIAVRERVASATVTAAGELWLVTGARNYAREQPCACLWRRPIDGEWTAVELEPLSLFPDDQQRWAHVLAEQTWIEAPAGAPPPRYPAARQVQWAADALWLTAELGPSYPTARERPLADPRTVLFSSVPVASASELIATDKLHDERVDRRVKDANFTPGSDDCRTFHMVVTDDPDGDGRSAYEQLLGQLDQLEDIATIERDDGWASASMIYVGKLDGRPQLIVEANSWNPPSARALADEFAQMLGRPLTLDCRPRTLLRPVQRFR